MAKQKTLKVPVYYEGIGLHSGQPVAMTIKPAPDNAGITFVRTDLPQCPAIPAVVASVTSTNRATTLGQGQVQVYTVEHLLAALYGAGISNAVVEMNSAEPPVADGCAQQFYELIIQGGVVDGDVDERVISLSTPVFVRDGDKYMVALPAEQLRISFVFANRHHLINTQYQDFIVGEQTFAHEIAPARTIGFMHELEALQKQGLGLGGSLDNVVVFDDHCCLSQLRFADEPVRHKILDIIGDLSLLGGRVAVHIIAAKSNHGLNAALAREIQKSCCLERLFIHKEG